MTSRLFACTSVAAFSAVLLSFAAIGHAQDAAPIAAEYDRLIASGDAEGALGEAMRVLNGIADSRGGSSAISAVKRRVEMLKDTRLRLENKLALVGAGESAFALWAPTPSELYKKVSDNLSVSRVFYQGLREDEKALAESAVATAEKMADAAVFDAYRNASAGFTDETRGSARAYLAAYVLGAHDGDDLVALLDDAAEAVGESDALPTFLFDCAYDGLGNFAAADRAAKALDAADWASWPAEKRLASMRGMADAALAENDHNWAVTAYTRIAESAEGKEAVGALRKVIDLYAEEAKKIEGRGQTRANSDRLQVAYRAAGEACGQFLARFPDDAEALNVEYRKIFYEYRARQHEKAVESARAFRQAHPDSNAMPNVLLLEGLAINDQGQTDAAIALFEEIVEKYRKAPAAARAQFMAGYSYLATQRYSEARECFQRVVDFYPDASSADEARELLVKLKPIETRQ
jgi:TolA-binding protein